VTSRVRASSLAAFAIAALALLTATGCDDSSNTPTSPSGTLQVTATRSVLRAGETMPLTVTAAGTPATGVLWSSTDASVVSVSATGQAIAGRPGRATVTAATATSSGSIALRVVPDYDGTWAGGVGRPQLTCSAASTSPICAPGAPTSGSITLALTQVGDQVTGTLVDSAEPTATVPVTGQVLDDGQLSLAGRVDVPAVAPTLRVEAATLRATFDVALGTVTGSYTLIVRRTRAGTTLQDDYTAQVQFRDLRRQ
jgi:hypothetical protein